MQITDLKKSLNFVNSAAEEVTSPHDSMTWFAISYNFSDTLISDKKFSQVEESHADNTITRKCFKPGNGEGLVYVAFIFSLNSAYYRHSFTIMNTVHEFI